MKAKFLKIAGVKSEKEFYKKYPTEAAFFKAHPEAKKQIKKAQVGSYIGGENETNMVDYSPINFANIQDQVEYSITGQDPALTDYLESLETSPLENLSSSMMRAGKAYDEAMAKSNKTAKKGKSIKKAQGGFSQFLGDMGGAQGLAGSVTGIIGGIQQLKEQKEAVKAAEQSMKVSDIAAQAAATRPEIPSRKYVRPEDMLTNPNERFMSYGTGTNILAAEMGAQIGGNPTEIQNMYNPGTLYSDLGFEPLMESSKVKNYQRGGKLSVAQDGIQFPGNMINTTPGGAFLWQSLPSNLPPGSNLPASNVNTNANKSKGAGFDLNMFAQKGGTDIAGQLAGAIPGVGQDAGSSIGGGIGKTLGTAIGGPIGGMIGNFAGKMIGGLIDRSDEKIEKFNKKRDENIGNIALQQGAQAIQGQFSGFVRNGGNVPTGEYGWVSNDWQPQVITKFGEYDVKDLLRPDPTMDTLRTGGNIRQNYMGPQDQMAFGGEMKTHWGGYAEPISYNPYLPGTGETVMFRGQSHDESDGKGRTGIGVSYGDTGNDDYTDYAEYGSKSAENKVDVEVERDEPAIETQDANGEKSMLVYGNLEIPKEFASEIGDSNLDHRDLPKFKNYVASLSKKEQKANNAIARAVETVNDIKPVTSFDKLALATQNAIIDANKIKLKQSAVFKQNAAALQQAINDTAQELGLDADALAKGKTKLAKPEATAKDGKEIKKAQFGAEEIQNMKLSDRKSLAKKYGVKDYDGSRLMDQLLAEKIIAENNKRLAEAREKAAPKKEVLEKIEKDFDKKREAEFLKKRPTPGKSEADRRYEEYVLDRAKKEKLTSDVLSTLKAVSSQAAPLLNDPYQEDLDPSQILGELTALATNQLQPVQAQTYQPDLAVPMGRVSLQDQLNANQADFNALQRKLGYNPEALSILAAQKYAANTKTLGDEFRLNQELQNQVFNKNRDTLNDARLKNLAILDTQYTRQEAARSNTKATFQEAMSSIASKTLQNKLENQQLAVMSNMFPQFGFNRNMRATARGLTFFEMPEIPGYTKSIDENGNVKYDKNEETATTTTPSTTSNTTTNPVTNKPTGQKHGGKTKKSFTNSSILKMYKG